VIFQLFALYLRTNPVLAIPMPAKYWQLPVVFYGIAAAGNLLVVPKAAAPMVTDAAGTAWKVSSILAASALVSILVMGAFTLLAWIRMLDQSKDPEHVGP